LHQQLGRLAEESPESLSDAEAVRAVESEFIHALVRFLDDNSPVTTTIAGRNHGRIIRRLARGVSGGESFSTVVSRRNMFGDRSLRKQPACVLPRAFRHEPPSISVAAAHASCAALTPAGHAGILHRHPDRDGSRLPGAGTIFHAVSFVVGRVRFRNLAPVTSEIRPSLPLTPSIQGFIVPTSFGEEIMYGVSTAITHQSRPTSSTREQRWLPGTIVNSAPSETEAWLVMDRLLRECLTRKIAAGDKAVTENLRNLHIARRGSPV
jgi:hypothetical protein